MPDSLLVVAVDPGPIPGVCVVSADDAGPVYSVFQCNAASIVWLVEGLLWQPAPFGPVEVGRLFNVPPSLLVRDVDPPRRRTILAVERFVIGMRSARLSTPQAAAVTRDMVGALTELGRASSWVELVQRSASEVMPWATDKRLSAAGLFDVTKGMAHARAAARHALFAATADANLPDPLSTKVRGR